MVLEVMSVVRIRRS